MKLPAFHGKSGFALVWVGQTLSVMGTSMTTFALTIWAWDKTGQATPLTLILAAGFVTYILLTPIAGIVVDRYSRKWVMLLMDLGAGMVSLAIFGLYASGRLEVWHLYVSTFLVGGLEAFHLPAYVTAATMLLPKDQYGRAAGMRTFSFSLANVVAPPLAGVLIGLIGVGGVIFVDVVTFLLASMMLWVVVIPRPARTEAVPAFSLAQMFYGFRYLWQSPELLGLQATLTVTNLFSAFTDFALLSALVLARSGGDEVGLGIVQAAVAGGGLVGGALISIWGGPQKKVRGILFSLAFGFLMNSVAFGLIRVPVGWAVCAFLGALATPVLVGAFYGLWQAKIPPDIQGRVFAARDILVDLPMPIGTLLAGPIADRFLEPGMQPGAPLAAQFGWLVGTGPGAGMALMFVLFGGCAVLISLAGFLLPPLRNLEERLPDYDH